MKNMKNYQIVPIKGGYMALKANYIKLSKHASTTELNNIYIADNVGNTKDWETGKILGLIYDESSDWGSPWTIFSFDTIDELVHEWIEN